MLLTVCFALSGLFQSGILVADLHEQYYSLLTHYGKILSGETGRHKILISYTPDKIYLISAGISVVGAVVLAVYIYKTNGKA